jgi:hypothetical protein
MYLKYRSVQTGVPIFFKITFVGLGLYI